MKHNVLSRRQFLVSATALAGGMSLSLMSKSSLAGVVRQASQTGDAAATDSIEMSPWVHILPDDSVTVHVPTPEIGNGSMTQMAMNVAEELGCDWSKVSVASASPRRDYLEEGSYSAGIHQPFFGGHSTDPGHLQSALQVGASARERLRAAAAARWQVPGDEIVAANSILTHKPTGRTLRYGEVAAEAASMSLTSEPALKPRDEWWLLGKAMPAKLHLPAVVNGTAVYGIDVQVPGMVHAALKQSPVHGGKLKSHNPEAVLNMPGVRAVVVVDPGNTPGTPVKSRADWDFTTSQVQSAVAVIADHYWQAKRALDALPLEWEPGAGAQWRDTEQIYATARALHDSDGGGVLLEAGDVSAASGDKTVEGTYSTPYGDQAVMEPLNGTALVTEHHAEVWCSTQDTLQAYWVAIDETGFMPKHVKIHQTLVGGGFGRRTAGDDVRMVVAVARAWPGVPVKTIWSREECFRQGRYRTPITSRFKAVLGDDGYPQAVSAKAAYIGSHPLYQLPLGYSDIPYFTSGVIPNVLLAAEALPVHVQNGAYRGPCYNSHAFFVETFIDECAVAAGIDPLDYRKHLLEQWDPAWTRCLEVAADKVGWHRPLKKGQGLGLAITNWPAARAPQAGTTVCAAAFVEVTPAGELRIKQIDLAFDCGRVINRDAVIAQLEGGVIFGLNAALNEELTIRDGQIAEENFHQYPLLKINQIPQINIHFDALSNHERFAMIGEAPVGPVGAAIGNAIFQATGKRIRSTPLLKHDLAWG